jgi:copper homeostasis protein CutC
MNIEETDRAYLKELATELSIVFCKAIDKINEQEKELIALKELLKQKGTA